MKNNELDISKANWSEDLLHDQIYDLVDGERYVGQLHPKQSFRIVEASQILGGGVNYFVPSYQRGYRWRKKEVIELLEDIDDWEESQGKYCLQPIVIAEKVNNQDQSRQEYILIDGQQRITTLYIIMKALKKPVEYTIRYETREQSQLFLENICDDLPKEKYSDNIDFYYMYQAYEAVIEYFKNDEHNINDWYNKLIDAENGSFFIEYEVIPSLDDRNHEEIFTGLNAGKIPLTNSELTKALLLKEKNFSKQNSNYILEIASEWDRIERRLSEPNFWSWLGQKEQSAPRIDFILDIVAATLLNSENNNDTSLQSYPIFTEWLSQSDHNILSLWKRIKECFMTFEDWYEDTSDYHYLGFLNATNKNLKVQKYYHDYITEKEFSFKEKVREKFEDVGAVSELTSDDDVTRDVLLFFNIEDCITKKQRLNFGKFNTESYDVEHIFPSSGFDMLQKTEERFDWLQDIVESSIFDEFEVEFPEQNHELNDFKISSLKNDEGNFCQGKLQEGIIEDETAFKQLYEQIIYRDSTGPINPNGIGNLCLLDATTNRGYGNKPFPNKVKKITEVDAANEVYILPCTKNVFLKYYSGLNINNYIWEEEDAEAYLKSIEHVFDSFLKEEVHHD